jgi:xanthine dehydrogenase accessory factor
VDRLGDIERVLQRGDIPVFIDPDLKFLGTGKLNISGIVDARMRKRPPGKGLDLAPLVIGLGPGFCAGENCHAVVETNRGHYLGRVIWDGRAEADTGIPGKVLDQRQDRVLRAPANGSLKTKKAIGDILQQGVIIGDVKGEFIKAPFEGVLRGLLRSGHPVQNGMKIGDLDPRKDARLARTVSEKSLAIGGGVLEALLTRPEIRGTLWN